MDPAESSQIYSEPPGTFEMSQTTSALLANMAMDVSLNTSGGAANTSRDANAANESRRPLHPIHNERGNRTATNGARAMGPKETLYREKFEGFVTKTIRSHAARGGAKLPSYENMNERERIAAMAQVDRLLQRLNCGSAGSTAFSAASRPTRSANDDTFGSATTMGEQSAPRNNSNQSVGSATTMGNDKSAITTLDQSVSLLEESLILLSDEEDAFLGGKSSSPASIERTRHAHNPRESVLLDSVESPSFEQKQSGKRSASNSGKRGLKSRLRVDGFEDAESSLLKHFESDTNDFLQEDAFSCGSPIQQRFSHDELDLEEERDTVSDMVNSHRFRSVVKAGNGEDESEEYSRFSLNEDVDYGNCDYEDDNDAGEDWDAQRSQRNDFQQSQWSTFQNADAKLTLSGDEEDDSPVRRRAIRFDGLSQRVTTSKKHRSVVQRREMEESDEEASLEEKMADMAVGDKNVSAEDDPIQTVRNLSRRAKALESQGVDSSLLDEVAPTDIRLRDGAHFRMDPLRCRQTKDRGTSQKSKSSKKHSKSVKLVHPKDKSKAAASKHYSSESENSLSDPEPSFTDPITRFPTRVAARLNSAFNFIMEKEQEVHQPHAKEQDFRDTNSINESCGVLISMPIQQIVSVTSKLLIQTIKSARMHQRSMNGLFKKTKRFTPMNLSQERDVMAGGTLIVLRGKEDIAQWEVALREYTSLSVMNHAEMQSNLRKLANTAAKCAGFDVVLSTYDAIKAKEVTVPVDENGRAILDSNTDINPNDDDGGWLTSRASGSQSGATAPRKCHQLSVLHRMSWHRLILMDVLGRSGFLTKPGTARAQAAVAINSLSRFILFEIEASENGKPEEKFKDDRRQLRSVTTALQLPPTLKLDKFISHFVLDVNKVGRGDLIRNASFSESEESVSEEECFSDEEYLTEPY